MKNPIFIKIIILSLVIITSIVNGLYFYLLIDNPIDKDINKVFLVYKDKGNLEELASNLERNVDALKSGNDIIFNEVILTEIKTVCTNFKNVDESLKKLDVTSDSIKPYKLKLIRNTQSILNLCPKPNADFYSDIDKPIEDLSITTTEMGNLLERSYKLKNTIVDKYPILSILTFILLFLLALLLIKKPKKWANDSIKISSVLFVSLLLLAVGLNPLYSFIVLIMIIYIGFLLIILNRQKA